MAEDTAALKWEGRRTVGCDVRECDVRNNVVFNEDRRPAGCAMVCAVAMINKNPNNSNGYALVWVQYRIIKT